MSEYNFDEGGVMAAYFAMSLLCLILIPLTFTMMPSTKRKPKVGTCECPDCEKQRAVYNKRTSRSITHPKFSPKLIFAVLGWASVAFLFWIVKNTKVDVKLYDPFEILGLRVGTAEKDIKRHYKKLSVKLHPDKVKLAVNETLEEVSAKFVEITKAYKSLTDETIRKNLEQYGHPDGRQPTSVGIAIPKGMISGKKGLFSLGLYAIILGGSLPLLLNRWWSGTRVYTKDGVHAKSAEAFFKNIREDCKIEDIILALATAWQYEKYGSKKLKEEAELEKLEKLIKTQLEGAWVSKSDGPLVRRSLVLIYAHLMRLPIQSTFLQDEQRVLLLHSPVLLNSLLNITLSRNWLPASLLTMRLNAYLAQAVKPSVFPGVTLFQFPGIAVEDTKTAENTELETLYQSFKSRGDVRAEALKRVGQRWGRLEIVDASFKVIGERIITPGAFVNLVVKLRIVPPLGESSTSQEKNTDSSASNVKADGEFLLSRKEAEDISLRKNNAGSGYAHSPRWPAPRRPQWWIVLGDDKTSKVVIPPLKLSEVPYTDPNAERNYRTWKITFQAPNQVGSFLWKVRIVSDTFVGEEAEKDMMLKLDDPALLETADLQEDEISDPEEDTLAGQMAAMRGQKVKKIEEGDEEDDSSETDEEEEEESSSDSD